MDDLKDLMDAPGPFASVVLAAPSQREDAAEQLGLRWRNARRELEGTDLPAADLDRLDVTVADLDHAGGEVVVLLQGSDAPAFVEHADEAADLVVVDSLPRVGPVLESRQRSIPHLVVVTDRTGADVVGVGADDEPAVAEVEGETLHIHRGHPGGWSQRRYQQRAENRWESNAGEVADAVTAMVERTGARLVAVAGDVRAVSFLLEQLPPAVSELAVKLEGQSEDRIAEESARLAADVVARDTRALLQRYDEGRFGDLAAAGPVETLDALSVGRVDTLLVHDDPADDRRARFAREGLWCAPLTADAAVPPGVEPAEGRLVDVAIRSALLGDSEIRMVPRHGGPDEGIGAVLRW